MGVEKMVCLASRTGRQFQRYNKGRRQVVGYVLLHIHTYRSDLTYFTQKS